jgi:hypothetical protein
VPVAMQPWAAQKPGSGVTTPTPGALGQRMQDLWPLLAPMRTLGLVMATQVAFCKTVVNVIVYLPCLLMSLALSAPAVDLQLPTIVRLEPGITSMTDT